MAKSTSQRVGQGAVHELRSIASERYPHQVTRIDQWRDTLTKAFQATAAGDRKRGIVLPAGVVSTATDGNVDPAHRVLDAFDALLGRGATAIALTRARQVVKGSK